MKGTSRRRTGEFAPHAGAAADDAHEQVSLVVFDEISMLPRPATGGPTGTAGTIPMTPEPAANSGYETPAPATPTTLFLVASPRTAAGTTLNAALSLTEKTGRWNGEKYTPELM